MVDDADKAKRHSNLLVNLEKTTISRLVEKGILQPDWKENVWRVVDKRMLLQKENNGWWLVTEQFHCVVDHSYEPFPIYWKSLDLDKMAERAAQLEDFKNGKRS